MEAYNFFNKINSIKQRCYDNTKEQIMRFINSQELAEKINEGIKQAFEEIEKNYINNNNNIFNFNNNNIDDDDNDNNNDDDNEEDNNEEEDEEMEDGEIDFEKNSKRRKFFILCTTSYGELSKIIENIQKKKNYHGHIIRRERLAAQHYRFWVLVQFNPRASLSSKKYFNCILKFRCFSKKSYYDFISNIGEPFNI